MPDRALRRLLSAHHARADELPALVMKVAPELGATAVLIHVVDYRQSVLVRLTEPGEASREPVPIAGTMAGRAFTSVSAQVGDGRLWLPLLNSTERLGVLEVVTGTPPTDALVETATDFAALIAETVVTHGMHSDVIERARRRLPMLVPAEIIWTLLPPLTFASSEAVITGLVEPCYDVGGDCFDYAANGHTVHLAIFDPIGHGIGASLLATTAISVYRNARRTGLDLADTYRSVDKWTRATHPNAFVTGILAELDTTTGRLSYLCAGHPPALLLRDGHLVRSLPAPTAVPMGLGHLATREPAVNEQALQPGDQVLMHTDGMVEARSPAGEAFGTERLVDFVARALADHLPAPESLRRLVHAVLRHHAAELQDDATVLLAEWRPTYQQPYP